MSNNPDLYRDLRLHYSDDFSTQKEVPQHRLKHRHGDAEGIEAPEREVMIQPNNIEFFYAEEETSERIWWFDNFMDKLYKVLSRSFAIGICVAVYLHFKQQYDMQKFAEKVSVRLEKHGGMAVVNNDNSVTILMDGKVQEVI